MYIRRLYLNIHTQKWTFSIIFWWRAKVVAVSGVWGGGQTIVAVFWEGAVGGLTIVAVSGVWGGGQTIVVGNGVWGGGQSIVAGTGVRGGG